MSERAANIQGACLCGAVAITVPSMATSIGACHCGMCKRWTGGPLMTVECGQEVVFSDPAQVGVFTSSEWAERGFCKSCGSHLFYLLKPTGQYIMAAGLFDLDERFRFDHQVFIDEKPAYYHFAEKTHDMTGAELFAQFQSGDDA